MDNNININNNNLTIEKIYENLSYFDLYGSSVIFVIIITILLILFCLYCSAMINSTKIKNDWVNQRCKPNIMPFAGYINKPPNISASNFTKQNFDYCVQQNITQMTSNYLQPLNFITNTLYFTYNLLMNSIMSSYEMINKMRELFAELMKKIINLLANILIPIQKIIIAFKDTFQKLIGILISSVYSFIGAYYIIQSLLGVVAKALVSVLIIMAAVVIILWLTPFTWGAAAAGTVILTSVAIPLAIFLDFFVRVFHVDLGLKVPKISGGKPKCFDENTPLNMNDGTTKPIKDIIPGDILENGNAVTGVFKVLTEGSELYDLNGVIVSDTHMVKYNNEWLRVSEHPFSRKLAFYENKPYLYCLNTVSKTIIINGIVFSDWDEVYDESLNLLENKTQGSSVTSGFIPDVPIILQNGDIKKISEIKVGDVLEKGEKVYGVVKIDGSNCSQFTYKIGKNMIVGGPNLIIFDKKYCINSTINLDEKYKNKRSVNDKYLFHLLTDKKTFKVNNVEFGDYNSSIDFFIN